MADMKKTVVKALFFESNAKNREDVNKNKKYTKLIPKELKFYDNPISFIDRSTSDDADKISTKALNPIHRSSVSKECRGLLKPSKMLVYEDCSEDDEPFRSTPPNIQVRKMIATPKAPMKSRKEFEKKVLRPKKLIYNDKENDYYEDLSKLGNSLYYSTPKKSDKNEEDNHASYYEKLHVPRKILPVRDEDNDQGIHSASRELNSASTSGSSVPLDKIINSRRQGSKKKNSNRGGLQELKKTNNVQKNDLNYDKENNAAQLRTQDRYESQESNLETYSSRSNIIYDRNYILPGNREDSDNLSRNNELTHFRI